MIQMKRNKSANFDDFLAALDHAGTQPKVEAASGSAATGREETIVEPMARPSPRLRWLLDNISWRWWGEAGASRSAPAALYLEEADEPLDAASANQPAPPPAEAEPLQTEDEEIAQELGLHAELASVELRRIRRDFAKKNHPDRFAPGQRIAAARRMTIANMLIDAHLKQKP